MSSRAKSAGAGRSKSGNKGGKGRSLSGGKGKFQGGRKMGRGGRGDEGQTEGSHQNSLVEKGKLMKLGSQKQIELLKQLHNKIVVSPQQNLKHLQTIFALIKTPNLQIVSKALRVLAEIFINIAPLDAIDMTTVEQRTENKIKKEEYKVLKFEKQLVGQYERYLKMLKEMHGKTKPENFGNDQEVYTEFKKCLLECVITLYRTLWNFNLAKELNDLCLKFIKYQQCRDFLKQMLMDKNIAVMSAKSKIISGIAKIIKSEQFQKRLPSDIIKIINCTYIDTRYLKKDQDSVNYKKKLLKKKLYREEAIEVKKEKEKRAEKGTLERKRQKREEKQREKLRVKDEINKEFAQGETTIQTKEITRYNSQILQQLFYIYFKILVQKINSIFLRDTLDGILKFVHLINIDLTQSLLEHLDSSASTFRDLWKLKKTEETMLIRILIVFTGQSIINGPLSVYQMDDAKMTGHFYRVLKDINAGKDAKEGKETKIGKELYRMICVTLEEMFVKRRQLSQEVIGSFAREVAILLSTKEIPKLYLLQLLRTLAHRYGKITRMFEPDNEGFGLNSFNAMCEDPQCTNAINTEIISFLRQIKYKNSKEYQATVDRVVDRLCKQNFLPKDVKENLYSILEREMEEGFF